MKKYLIPALALAMITGIANAQAQKQPATAKKQIENPDSKKTVFKSSPSATTATVAPQSTQVKSATPVIKRKHRHMRGKSVKKAGNK